MAGDRAEQPITDKWLRANGFRIEDGRADPRMPIRSRAIGHELDGGRPPFGSHDDLCIDVSPRGPNNSGWYVWVAQREPYRHIHVRTMRHRGELIRLYEGLTGADWVEAS